MMKNISNPVSLLVIFSISIIPSFNHPNTLLTISRTIGLFLYIVYLFSWALDLHFRTKRSKSACRGSEYTLVTYFAMSYFFYFASKILNKEKFDVLAHVLSFFIVYVSIYVFGFIDDPAVSNDE